MNGIDKLERTLRVFFGKIEGRTRNLGTMPLFSIEDLEDLTTAFNEVRDGQRGLEEVVSSLGSTNSRHNDALASIENRISSLENLEG